ncbi:MAG: deoxyribose-phosphate aldolase [Verrucomicrobiota bacterium]
MQNPLARFIDHTLLKPEATRDDILRLCEEAKTHHFYSVCIHPYWIVDAKKALLGTSVKIVTVIGFPHGASLPQVKAFETTAAIAAGADEIDMVINLGAAEEKHWDFVEHEIHSVVSAAHGRVVKVILETCLHYPDAVRELCVRAVKAGAQFVKTSTGFHQSGATEEAVRIMRDAVGPTFGVKASGGIRTREIADKMLAAGANRLGCSSSLSILQSTTSPVERTNY